MQIIFLKIVGYSLNTLNTLTLRHCLNLIINYSITTISPQKRYANNISQASEIKTRRKGTEIVFSFKTNICCKSIEERTKSYWEKGKERKMSMYWLEW